MPEGLLEFAAVAGPGYGVAMTIMWWFTHTRAERLETRLLDTLDKTNEQAKLLREVLKGKGGD